MAFAWALNELIRPGDEAGSWRFLLVGAVAGACTIALYGAFRRHATQLGAFAGSWAAIGGAAAADVGTDEPFGLAFGVAACLASIGWFWAGRAGRLPPPAFAMAIGAVGALLSPLWLADRAGLMYAVAIPVAAGLVVASAGGADPRSAASLVVAGLGLFGYIFAAIMEYLADSVGAPLALLLVGFALIGIALIVIRLSRRSLPGREPPSPAP